MYCKHCGALQDDNAVVCSNCNGPLKDAEQLRDDAAQRQADAPQQGGNTPQQGYTPYQQDYNQTPQQGFNPPPQQGYNQTPPQGQGSGQPYQQNFNPPPPQKSAVKSWLIPNIIITVLSLCCCLPLVTGIIGIVFSAMVSGKEQQGDIAGAEKNANTAKIMFFVSLALTVISIISSIILSASGIMTDILDSISNPYYGW